MEDERNTGGTAELIGRKDDETMDADGQAPIEAVGHATVEERQLPPQAETDSPPLVDEGTAEGFRTRWQECQAGFVDEPREAVQGADALVADVIRQLATQFADERKRLEDQWDRGEDVSTEDLRVALQTYRSFFNRLLKV